MTTVSDKSSYRVPPVGASNLPAAVSHHAINTSLGNAPCQFFDGAGRDSHPGSYIARFGSEFPTSHREARNEQSSFKR